MLGNRRGPDAPGRSASGFYYGDTYRYRKDFELTEQQVEGSLLLEFEGVYRDARIIVNDTEIEAPPYGFIPFFVNLDGLVQPGNNHIEVHASNADQPDCRWYSGAGIYRPVWLWEGNRAHIEPEGIRVTTLSTDPAIICVQTTTTGDGYIEVSICDADETVVATGIGTDVQLRIPNANLWNDTYPYLYFCSVRLSQNGQTIDTARTPFGIRSLAWDESGLRVNGRETLLRGGCIHCDNGIIGAASFAECEHRRVELLKRAGFNALRIAHNPASASLLKACDELGMYVMDEAWDGWFTRKSVHDYSRHFLEWCDHDLQRLASRDYNHPSVIMYSIGNEITDPLLPGGVDIERSLVELLHSLDSTRPVTCGMNLAMLVMERAGRSWYSDATGVAEAAQSPDETPRGSLLFNLAAQATGTSMTMLASAPGADKLVSPALEALDIAGYNYAATRYAVDAHKHPHRIIVGSETFPHELDHNWRLVEGIPNLIGDFMWAAWDYLGEAGAGAWAYTAEEAGFSKPWPWLIAGSGALDLLGNPNAHAALAAAVWNTASAPSIQVRPVNIMGEKTYRATWRGSDAIPSWSWSGCEGTKAQVEVYDGHARFVRLVVNGKTLGVQRVRRYAARFTVPYEPGTICAVALDENGRELARSFLESAIGPLELRIDQHSPQARAGDAAYLSISIVGSNNIVESNADETLTVRVAGGELLGFGSARPATTERFQAGRYTTYRGQAAAVVHRSDPGEVTVTVMGETLGSATASITFS